MRRRDFITLVGGASVAWPLAARAQQAGKLPTIGFLGSGTVSTGDQWVAAFVQRMRELAWIEGRTVAIEYRWAEGRNERSRGRRRVRPAQGRCHGHGRDPTDAAAKQATSAIPIVFVLAGDPVGSGFVASLSRPGGNVTGVSNQTADTRHQAVGLLHELIPGLRQLAIIANSGNAIPMQEMREVQCGRRHIGIAVTPFEIRQAEDIAPAFDALRGHADAVHVCADGLTNSSRTRINALALAAKLPTMHGNREQLEGGGLISYGANTPDLFRRAADYVDKVLRGAKPADLPVEDPTKFELVINMKTAKTLGLAVPYSMQLLADEVIE